MAVIASTFVSDITLTKLGHFIFIQCLIYLHHNAYFKVLEHNFNVSLDNSIGQVSYEGRVGGLIRDGLCGPVTVTTVGAGSEVRKANHYSR